MPRKRRAAKARRPEDAYAALDPYVIDVLLEGWSAQHEHPDADPFAPFDLSEDDWDGLRERHRPELEAEAQRRGIPVPWATNNNNQETDR